MHLNDSDADEAPVRQGSDSPQYEEVRPWFALRLSSGVLGLPVTKSLASALMNKVNSRYMECIKRGLPQRGHS
jgi:hypothetical protein